MTTIVLLPGMDGTGSLFADFASALQPEVATTVMAYPNDAVFGYLELEALVRKQLPAKEPFFLLGESFSGPIAVAIAADPPAKLRGLILSCSFVRNPRPGLSWLRSVMPLLPTRLPGAILSSLLLGRFSSKRLRQSMARALAPLNSGVLRARLAAVLSVDVVGALSKVQVPVLYLRATEDRVVPASAVALVTQSLPGVAVVALEGPHFLLQVAPVDAARHVKEFIHEANIGP